MSQMTDPGRIREAARLLARGGLVAFPTETVYGLGADADNPDAVRRIFAAKGRPADHPLIVHLAGPAQLGEWAREVPPEALRLARAFWPGPLTLVLPRAARVSDLVTGGQDSVGLRVPSHPVARALLQAFGGGVAGPSANRFGRVSPTTAAHVHAELGEAVDLVLEGGPSEVGIESAIVDLSSGEPALLRPGVIGAAALAAALGRPLGGARTGSPRVSGALASHYAPATPSVLVAPGELLERLEGAPRPAAVLARRPCPPNLSAVAWVEAPVDPLAYARHLYASLRTLDAAGAACLLVEAVPDAPEWQAVGDRLARATRPLGSRE